MKKIIALIGLSILFGCGQVATEVVTETEEEVLTDEVTEIEEPINEEVEEAAEILEQIILEGDSKDCKDIEVLQIRETCEQKFIYDDAVESGDTENCATLTDEFDQETCVTAIDQERI